MRIQHNIAALNAHRQLGGNNNNVSKNLEKLSSGYKINRAGDDAAGLGISEKMRAQITGLETASKNANDGISLIQTAEGALTEVHSMLNRMVELATQSSNGTYGVEERTKINNEVSSLKDEIDRIAEGTNFNGINLLDGNLGSTGSLTATGGKPAATVSVDLAKNGTLTQEAAKKAKFTTDATDVIATGDTGSYDIAYKDAAGVDKSINVLISADVTAGDPIKYSLDGGKTWVASATNTDAGGATTAITTGQALIEALGETELADLFTIADEGTPSGKIVFEAKNAGATGAAIISIKENLDITQTANTSSLNAKIDQVGADKYTKFAAATFDSWDGTTGDGKDSIFEVNGKKFAFVDSDEAAAKLGKDVTTVKTAVASTVGNAEVIKMVDFINLQVGKGTAEVDITTNTQINFKSIAASTAGASGSNKGLTLQVGDTNDDFQKVTVTVDSMSAKSLGLDGVNVAGQIEAGKSIDIIKAGIEKVSTARGNLGALQNRLDHTINNLGVTTENMTAAESRIRDVDMAQEMMEFTKNNILTQASQSMLAQANQLPQGVLQLLQ